MEIMREIHGYARTQFGPHGHLNTVSRHCPLPVCSTILYIADINKKMIDYHGFTVVYQIRFFVKSIFWAVHNPGYKFQTAP